LRCHLKPTAFATEVFLVTALAPVHGASVVVPKLPIGGSPRLEGLGGINQLVAPLVVEFHADHCTR
jgi:hypothetical protein